MKRVLSLLLTALLVTAMPSLAAEGEPKVLRFATASLKGAFNPLLPNDVYDDSACKLMFAALNSLDAGNNVVFNENCVATGYELTDDHLTYTFTLKEGLTFSNGDPLTASDVAFTYKMLAHPLYDGPRAHVVADMVGYAAYHAGEAEDFEGIKVLDERTVSFTLVEPYVAKIEQFAECGILSEAYYSQENYESFKALSGAPMGAGPFMLDSFEPGKAFSAVRNPNWFGEAPKLDGVTMLCIPPEEQIAALAGGECDLIEAPAANMANLEAIEAGGAQAIRFAGLVCNGIMLNHQSSKLSDVNVRRALMHGFDRWGFIEAEYEGFAEPCAMLVYQNPVFWAHPRDMSSLNPYEYIPELAAQMLHDAGWEKNADGMLEKDGEALNLTIYTYNEAPWSGKLAALLKEQWGALGIGVKVKEADVDTVLDMVYEKRQFDQFDMWTQGWQMRPDPDMTDLFGEIAYETPGGLNPGGYVSEEAEQLFAAGRQAFDPGQRAEIYAEWAVLSNQTLPMLFNAVPEKLWGVAPGVTGFDDMNAFYNWADCIYDVDIVR